jgi:hypothetical protein
MDLDDSFVPWQGVVRPYAVPGLSTCLEEHRLCRDGSPLPVSRLEIEALYLAEWAVARRQTLVLCPADPLAPLSELVAAAVHVADMAAIYRKTGQARGSGQRVAVVSSDYHTRGLYRSLGVRSPRSLSAVPLRDVVPAATLGRDGVVRVLGLDPRHGWSTVFVSSVSDLRLVGRIDLAVVDLSASGADGVLDLGVPVVVVARDPADPLLTRLANKALVFSWDRSDLARVRMDPGLPPRLACRADASSCDVLAVSAHALCENAALFWQDVGPLVRSAGGSGVGRQLALEAFSLFHDLLGLALPLELYESLTVPLHVRLDAIASAARLTQGETRDLYLPMVEAELRDLAKALGATPPKCDALRHTLGLLLDDHRDVMLVARTAEMARLYAADLAGDRFLARVRVTSLGALSHESPADVAVLTGMAPTWARWVYRAGIAGLLRVLAYAPDGRVESVSQGFSEADIVRRAIADQEARESWFGRPAAKDRVWSHLSGQPALISQTAPAALPTEEAARVPVVVPQPVEVPPGLWDGLDWFAELEPGGQSTVGEPDRSRVGRGTADVVSAVKVTFTGGRWCLLDVAGMVTRFRPASGIADAGFPVNRLKVGDRVLFLDEDSRKDLLAKVLEVAGEVPELAVDAAWVGHWRRLLWAAYQRFGTYDRFASALRANGCTLETQTIRLWVVGATMRPDDRENVRRVGIVTEDQVLLDHHAVVYRAMSSLRGAHVRLTGRLADMARHLGPAAAAGRLAADEVVDERSGLTAADFQDSIDIQTVQNIQPAGDVPYIVIGRLNRAEMEEFHD